MLFHCQPIVVGSLLALHEVIVHADKWTFFTALSVKLAIKVGYEELLTRID